MTMSISKPKEINPNHGRVITVGLYLLEKSLENIEEAITARDKERITYKVNHCQDNQVQNAVLQDVEKIRKIIRDLKNELNLQLQEESVARKVRGEAAHMWEMLCDMNSSGLNRYGKTPKELADFLDPRVEALIEISLRIRYLIEAESNEL
jgi:uncharacterized protein YpuA (DUF1002 family)